MKRFMFVCAAAAAILAGSEQKASAWSKFNFNVGLNISYEGGGNCVLWGLFKGAPYPGGYGHTPVFHGFHGYQGGYEYNQPYHYGYNDQNSVTPSTAPAAPATQPAPAAEKTSYAPASTQQVGYYYYPYSSYHYSQYPSYWYGQ